MGYSSRYHAASLAAVFIALAVGILIGVGLADDVVTTASQEVEQSLRSDAEQARQEAEELQAELDREREFSAVVMPALIDGRLSGSRVALVGLGPFLEETAAEVQAAVDLSGGSLEAVAAVDLPPDLDALADAAGRRFGPLRRDAEALERLGSAVGESLGEEGTLLDRLNGALFSRFSGTLDEIDAVVVVPPPPGELDAEAATEAAPLVRGLARGLAAAGVPVVAAQPSSSDPAALLPLTEAGLPASEHIDLAAGKVSLVYSLTGAPGHYGFSGEAERFMPELAGSEVAAP